MIEIALAIWAVYLLIGLLFGMAFVIKGVTRIDATAREGASWGFRLLILPGSIALWPLMAKRWFGGSTEAPEERSPHRCAACTAACSKAGGAT